MKKKHQAGFFLQRGCCENFTHGIVLYQLQSFRLQLQNFTKKVHHHHYFPNDFVKRFKTGLTNYIIFLFTIEKSCCIILKKQMFTSTQKISCPKNSKGNAQDYMQFQYKFEVQSLLLCYKRYVSSPTCPTMSLYLLFL